MVNIILQANQNMVQKCFNMSQLPSPNEGLVLATVYNCTKPNLQVTYSAETFLLADL